jgi:hypothetical protein
MISLNPQKWESHSAQTRSTIIWLALKNNSVELSKLIMRTRKPGEYTGQKTGQ